MPRMHGISTSFGGAHQMFEGNDKQIFFSLKSIKNILSCYKYNYPAETIRSCSKWVEALNQMGLSDVTQLLEKSLLTWPPLINEYKTWTNEQKLHICETRKDQNYANNLQRLGQIYHHNILHLATKSSCESDQEIIPKLKNQRQINDIDVAIGYPFVTFLRSFSTHSSHTEKYVFSQNSQEIEKSSLEGIAELIKMMCVSAPQNDPANAKYLPWDLFRFAIQYICPRLSTPTTQRMVIKFDSNNIAWSKEVEFLRNEMNTEQPFLYALYMVACMLARGCTSAKITDLCQKYDFKFPHETMEIEPNLFFNLILVFVTTKFLTQLNSLRTDILGKAQRVNNQTGLVDDKDFAANHPSFIQALLSGKSVRNPNEWFSSFNIHDLAKGGLRFFKSTGNTMTTGIKALEIFNGQNMMLYNLNKIERCVASVYMEKARNLAQSADHISVHFDGTQLRKLPEIQCFIFQAVNLHLQQTSGPIAGFCQVLFFSFHGKQFFSSFLFFSFSLFQNIVIYFQFYPILVLFSLFVFFPIIFL